MGTLPLETINSFPVGGGTYQKLFCEVGLPALDFYKFVTLKKQTMGWIGYCVGLVGGDMPGAL